MRALVLLLVGALLVGCKGGSASGTAGGANTVLKDAPPATLEAGWTNMDHGVGFTLAMPPGWTVQPLTKEALQAFVAERNENAWDIMNERKADVDFDSAQGMGGMRKELGSPYEGIKFADQMLIAIREKVGKISLDEAVARWKDTLFGGSAPPPVKETTVELPVGQAKALTAAETTLGIIDKTTVFFLVDGEVQYTLFFIESAAGGAAPIPVTQIMETFRQVRP